MHLQVSDPSLIGLLLFSISLISWLAWCERLKRQILPQVFQSNARVTISILTVRPSDDILQKSILRGHKSPPTPRHPAPSLSRLACGWISTPRSAVGLHGSCGSGTARGCLGEELVWFVCSARQLPPQPGAVRWCLWIRTSSSRRRKQRFGKKNPRRRGRGSTRLPNRSRSATCWTRAQFSAKLYFQWYVLDYTQLKWFFRCSLTTCS